MRVFLIFSRVYTWVLFFFFLLDNNSQVGIVQPKRRFKVKHNVATSFITCFYKPLAFVIVSCQCLVERKANDWQAKVLNTTFFHSIHFAHTKFTRLRKVKVACDFASLPIWSWKNKIKWIFNSLFIFRRLFIFFYDGLSLGPSSSFDWTTKPVKVRWVKTTHRHKPCVKIR